MRAMRAIGAVQTNRGCGGRHLSMKQKNKMCYSYLYPTTPISRDATCCVLSLTFPFSSFIVIRCLVCFLVFVVVFTVVGIISVSYRGRSHCRNDNPLCRPVSLAQFVAEGTCVNTCQHARDGYCDDPRSGGVCPSGTDCQVRQRTVPFLVFNRQCSTCSMILL